MYSCNVEWNHEKKNNNNSIWIGHGTKIQLSNNDDTAVSLSPFSNVEKQG